eukprot:PITA_28088
MNIISWNAKGLNSHAKHRILKRKIQKYKPEIMFLQETKCSGSNINNLCRKLGRNMEVLENASQGREGGLATIWDTKEIQMLSVEANKHFMAVEFQPIGNSGSFLCINIYSPQKLEDKINFLDALTRLIIRHPRSKCILGGDFNMITTLLEKKGGLRKLNRDAEAFTVFIENVKLEKFLSQQWHKRCIQEETLWKQKSRIQWLREGEQNTKFFHRSALDHRSANRILELKNNAGEILKNHNDISALLSDHFKSIAQEPPINREEAIKELTTAIPKSITSEQNWALCREISLEEVEEAIRSMPNDKAPGPNGFTINFYKACWSIVKQEVWEVVEDSRRSGTILKSINSIFLALIPKVEEAKTPDKFRPIALCNVIYKIISKFIANILKTILPGIISEEQLGYVEGRKILDNILLAQEMIHSLHSRKEAGMLMQLDLSKAYDKVS